MSQLAEGIAFIFMFSLTKSISGRPPLGEIIHLMQKSYSYPFVLVVEAIIGNSGLIPTSTLDYAS